MTTYYWDERIEYLIKTRKLYYNDDYLEFLVKSVLKIEAPVSIVDFGCGYGFLGLKLLQLLPKGSRYTGIDIGEKLINKAKEIFKESPYDTNFINADVNEFAENNCFDIAVCHSLLLHLPEPRKVIKNMTQCVKDNGRIICFEPNWISSMANIDIDSLNQSEIVKLGILQKLYENMAKNNGKNGNIGIKIPALFHEMGIKNIECRVSDKVVFLNQQMNKDDKELLFNSLKEDGIGNKPENCNDFIKRLVKSGLPSDEAEEQFISETLMAELFTIDSTFTWAPTMKITYGVVEK